MGRLLNYGVGDVETWERCIGGIVACSVGTVGRAASHDDNQYRRSQTSSDSEYCLHNRAFLSVFSIRGVLRLFDIILEHDRPKTTADSGNVAANIRPKPVHFTKFLKIPE
jgi:hypothetical protein